MMRNPVHSKSRCLSKVAASKASHAAGLFTLLPLECASFRLSSIEAEFAANWAEAGPARSEDRASLDAMSRVQQCVGFPLQK